jgi:hypothetical protein
MKGRNMPSKEEGTHATVPDGCNGELADGVLVHSSGTCIRHQSLPYRLAAFAATLADEYGWPVDELLQSAIPYSREAEIAHQSRVSRRLHVYVVRSANGEREWQAEDEQHAREQHEEAFAGEPGEAITAVRREQPARPPDRFKPSSDSPLPNTQRRPECQS